MVGEKLTINFISLLPRVSFEENFLKKLLLPYLLLINKLHLLIEKIRVVHLPDTGMVIVCIVHPKGSEYILIKVS